MEDASPVMVRVQTPVRASFVHDGNIQISFRDCTVIEGPVTMIDHSFTEF